MHLYCVEHFSHPCIWSSGDWTQTLHKLGKCSTTEPRPHPPGRAFWGHMESRSCVMNGCCTWKAYVVVALCEGRGNRVDLNQAGLTLDELELLLSLPLAPEQGITYKTQDFLHDTTRSFLKFLFGFKIVSVCRYLWYWRYQNSGARVHRWFWTASYGWWKQTLVVCKSNYSSNCWVISTAVCVSISTYS